MSKISKEKQEKIMSNIVALLFQHSPQALFTSDISKIEARDEEFIKRLLHELKRKGMILLVNKSPKGMNYIKRQRWRLSNEVYEVYNKKQNNQNQYLGSF